MNTDKKNKIMAIFITVAAFLVLGGIGFAFFSSTVSNDNNEKIQTETATMSLKFDDNDNGISGTLNLGQSITKKFTLQNTGTVDAYAKINWYNLVNTYTPNSLTYTLEQSTSENGTYTSIGSGKVPTSSAETTKQLKNGILVPVNTTYYYKLTITLNNLDIEQNSDINASFYSYFNLEEGKLTGADTIQNLVAGEPTNSTNVITKTAPQGATCTNTLAYDGTVDNNLRYVGANPCNYVTFNGETAGWRIVGIMNNVDDGTGNLETRIKLIRATSLGSYSWDSSASGVNGGYGVNDWTGADLKNELNGDYLNTSLNTNTMWYNYWSNTQTGEYDYTKGLSQTAQSLIGDAKWYLGGTPHQTIFTDEFYKKERGTVVVGNPSGTCNDEYCPRTTSWIGMVALIYPSDFGYAVGGTVRNQCLKTYLRDFYDNNCYANDYLVISLEQHWTITPISNVSCSVNYIDERRLSGSGVLYSTYEVHPSVYLKSDVTISGGNGSPENPYVIG